MDTGNPRISRLPLPVVVPGDGEIRPVNTCEGCGVCCREQSLPPYLDEIDLIPLALQKEVIEARKHESDYDGKPCIWWDPSTRKCVHHDDRPNICREYEVGGELCLEIREKYGVKDKSKE